MRCEDVQEQLSARIDGEDLTRPGTEVDDHVAGCATCAAFEAGMVSLHRRVRVRAAAPVPDLAEVILAAAPTTSPGRSLGPVREWARYALLGVALVQLLIALPALLLGEDAGATIHIARELGGWDVALASAWLLVAWAPRRAVGLLPFAVTLAAVMTGTALLDVVNGRVPMVGEAHHVLDLAGLLLLWLLARSTPSSSPLIPRVRPAHQA